MEVLAGNVFRRNHLLIQNNSPYSDVTGSPFKLPTDSRRDLKWQIHTVMCWFFRQNHRRNHRWSFHQWNRWKKLIYVSFASPPLFLLLLPNPNSPHLQTTSPPSPPKQKSPSYQHNKLYFLKFCGHNIHVLIYRWILSIFVSNSIFLNFNILLNVNFIVFFSICILLVDVHVLLLFLKQTCSIWMYNSIPVMVC